MQFNNNQSMKFVTLNQLKMALLSQAKSLNDVFEILNNKVKTQTELAKIYKVTQGTISSIKLGKIWKHLQPNFN
jgi:hypothetical protein